MVKFLHLPIEKDLQSRIDYLNPFECGWFHLRLKKDQGIIVSRMYIVKKVVDFI